MKKRSMNAVLDEAAELPMKLSVVLLHPSHKSHRPFVMIEGDRASLELLANVIHAAANRDDCGFNISPQGPGNLYFTACSELGLYFHRLPCEDSENPMGAADTAAQNTRRKKPYALKTNRRRRVSRGD